MSEDKTENESWKNWKIYEGPIVIDERFINPKALAKGTFATVDEFVSKDTDNGT